MEAENGGLAHILNSQASRLFALSDGGMEFGMPNGPTSRETSRKDTGDAVTTGLVLAAVVATIETNRDAWEFQDVSEAPLPTTMDH